MEISLEAAQDFRHGGTGYCSFFNTLFPVFGGVVGGGGAREPRHRDSSQDLWIRIRIQQKQQTKISSEAIGKRQQVCLRERW